MSFQSAEQSKHDRINLGRLVKRLEKAVTQDFRPEGSDEMKRREDYIKAQGTMQKIKYAQKLLKNADVEQLQSPRYNQLRTSLDRMQDILEGVMKSLEPQPTRPESILPSIPKPRPIDQVQLEKSPEGPDKHLLSPEDAIKALPTGDLLLSPLDELPSPPEDRSLLIPPSLPPTSLPSKPTSSTTTTTAPLQSTNTLHDELASHLSQMASQLKANAVHFSSSLAKDQSLVEEAQEKLEGNYDVMKRERTRVRDFRGKSGGTTCLVITSVIAVLVSFVIMVFIIRWTR